MKARRAARQEPLAPFLSGHLARTIPEAVGCLIPHHAALNGGTSMITLYDYLPSQNGYKVRLLLSHLRRPYRTKQVAIFDGAGQTEEFRAKSPTGAVPVLELEDGRVLAESNAILGYLAEGTAYLPTDSWERAQVSRWMYFEEDFIQNGLASLRHWTLTGKLARRSAEMIAAKQAVSRKTLKILDTWLEKRRFLTESGYTIADMSVFAYVSRADEAGVALATYPAVSSWVTRVRAQDGFLDTVYPYSIDPSSGSELQ
jgi:glutathione S-transferase